MKRFLAMVAVVLAGAAAKAESEPGLAARMRAGGDVGLLFRDEAGGNRSILGSISPRLAYDVNDSLRAVAWYSFAYARGTSTVFDARTQHHRLGLGAEYALRVRKADFVGGAGLAGVLMHTTLVDHGTDAVSTTVVRPAGWLSLALEVPLDAVTLRWDVTFTLARARQDVAVGIGVTLPLEGR